MSNVSGRAAAARENARQSDGKFGSFQLDDAGTDANLDMSFLDQDSGGDFGAKPRPLENQTPVDIDKQLVELARDFDRAEHRLNSTLTAIHTTAGDRRHYVGGTANWGMSDEHAIERVKRIAEEDQTYVGTKAQDCLKDLKARQANLEEMQDKLDEINEEFEARGGWTRGWLANSVNGHVHSSQRCSTCNKGGQDTSFELMADFSGQSEDEIVKAAGYRACTTCYPSAPVDATPGTHPTMMYSRDEKQAQAEREKRAAAKAEKAKAALAKAPTLSGEPIEVHDHLFNTPSTKTLKTERAAEQWWVDQWEPEESNRNTEAMRNKYEDKKAELDLVVEQLAAKKGVEVEELRQQLRAKAIKKNGYRWGL